MDAVASTESVDVLATDSRTKDARRVRPFATAATAAAAAAVADVGEILPEDGKVTTYR